MEPITTPQLTKISILINEKGLDRQEVRERFNVGSLKDISKQDAMMLIDELEPSENINYKNKSMKLIAIKNKKTNENQPDYKTFYQDENGAYHNIMAIWVSDDGERLSIDLTDENLNGKLQGYIEDRKRWQAQNPISNPPVTQSKPAPQATPDDDLPF